MVWARVKRKNVNETCCWLLIDQVIEFYISVFCVCICRDRVSLRTLWMRSSSAETASYFKRTAWNDQWQQESERKYCSEREKERDGKSERNIQRISTEMKAFENKRGEIKTNTHHTHNQAEEKLEESGKDKKRLLGRKWKKKHVTNQFINNPFDLRDQKSYTTME